MVHLSGVIGNTWLAVDVLQWLQDLSAPHICPHAIHFGKSFVHGLLVVLNTLPVSESYGR